MKDEGSGSASQEATDPASAPRADAALTWALCIATLNRPDVLKLCVEYALAQSRPPSEIAVVDASERFDDSRAALAALTEPRGVALTYVAAPKKSSAVQRNHAASLTRADVVFFMDDDCFLYPDCAERVMRAFEADEAGLLAAVGINMVPDMPPQPGAAAALKAPERKQGHKTKMRAQSLVRSSALARWLQREILMMAPARMFVPYDSRTPHVSPARLAELGQPDLRHERFLGAGTSAVRRSVTQREPFDPHLLAYCPTEDLDASYRYARHGLTAVLRKAYLHHYEASGGRVKRRQVTLLGLLNSAYFTRRSMERPALQIPHYYSFLLRRILGEFLKDLGVGRLSFPQARGAVEALVRSVPIFLHPREGLGPWYETVQKQILKISG